MPSKSISFVQLPLLTKPEPSPEENAYYAEYWQVMGRIFEHMFPQGEAYTIPELPLWITRLSAVARRLDWFPRLINFAPHTGPEHNINLSALATEICATRSSIVAMSPYTANYQMAVELARRVKRLVPATNIIVGGPHVSELPEEALRDGFDYVISGRGEAPLSNLLSELAAGRRVDNGFPGLHTDSRHQRVGEHRELFQEFWSMDADYDIIPAEYPLHYARIYATLGCPYRCSFCADTLWIGMRPYIQDIGRLRRELTRIKERFDPAVLFVGDEVFTLNYEHCSGVIDLLGEIGIPWFCQTRANLLVRDNDRELLAKMPDAGCRLINIGAESTDSAVIQNLQKRITTDQLRAACANAKQNGLGVLTYWMVGAPGETRESAGQTLEDIVDMFDVGLTDLVDYFICTPYPGTSIYKDPDKYGVTIARRPWRMWREDIPSVMRTAVLSSEEIHDLWLSGLRRITQVMRAEHAQPAF
jgi:anaerobic magnesium-protoporphyrin IX monomethyl ester cyclase